MTAIIEQPTMQTRPLPPPPVIPDYLVYETLDGIPLYYRGYENVLSNTETLEDIIGYGSLQWVLLTLIGDHLRPLLGDQFLLLQGEGGLRLSHRSNLSLDLAVFEKSRLSFDQLKDKYFDFPPKLIVEVDTKAHHPEFVLPNYYNRKTQRLLNFGVEQVVWVYTDPRKIVTAKPTGPWLTVNWDDDIDLMGHKLNLQTLVEQFS